MVLFASFEVLRRMRTRSIPDLRQFSSQREMTVLYNLDVLEAQSHLSSVDMQTSEDESIALDRETSTFEFDYGD